jgi:pimeloyl-ACP methyl ester carboxylesterase
MLHYTIHGNQHVPTVVLLHGFLSDSEYWKPLVPMLTKTHRVIAIDLLGFGASKKPHTSDYSLTTHTRAVQDTLEHLGVRHFSLAGHSMGALVAGNLAHAMVDSVEKLVIFNMPLFNSHHQARESFKKTSPLYRAMLYSPVGRVGWPVLKRAAATKAIRRAAPRSLRPIIKAAATNTHASRSKSLRNTIERTDAMLLLQSLAVPTNLIQGTHDRTVYRKNLIRTELPPNILVEWVATGHHTPLKLLEFSKERITQ